ncbi:flagellar protein FlaG [Pseudomonas duriflava]|uniref:Flagellar protein FlaG n=1 Tax=Pseudomonas duriflava TaxID=459528 RepID=A0A562PSJ8_9PSED|nr:flagellar protein FlaG [Pseudomonas duriflava]TWI47046.1 flagellar protein FlaG [Pseudomonas duriflava]
MDINAIADWSQKTTAVSTVNHSQNVTSTVSGSVVAQAGVAQTGTSPTAPTLEQLKSATSEMNAFASSVGRNINFSLDESTEQIVVKVIDRASGDLIRQIPSEEALRVAENIKEMRGLLFKAEA